MRLYTATVLLSFATIPLVSAIDLNWHLTLTTVDGGNKYFHGKKNSAEFDGSWNTDTFELYKDKDCENGWSYKNGKGKHTLTPTRAVKSYKVY
ncbi:hypothetical protein SLS61_003964 [Didymella pomorum]